MCKELCETTEEGRALWNQWRLHRDNWKLVREFHNHAVLDAIRASLTQGKGQAFMVMCPRDGGDAEIISVTIVPEPE